MNDEKITIGGVDYTIPPITLGQLKKWAVEELEKHDKLIKEEQGFASMVIRGEVIARAMVEKYSKLVADDVLEALNAENIQRIWPKFLGVSGFKPGEVEAAKPTGT